MCWRLVGCGAGDRTRTGKEYSGGFSSHCIFQCQPNKAVRALDYAFTMAACRFRCPPSSLYTFPLPGLARCCLGRLARGFAEFEGIHTGAFAARCSNVISPLCLPISPPRQGPCSVPVALSELDYGTKQALIREALCCRLPFLQFLILSCIGQLAEPRGDSF